MTRSITNLLGLLAKRLGSSPGTGLRGVSTVPGRDRSPMAGIKVSITFLHTFRIKLKIFHDMEGVIL